MIIHNYIFFTYFTCSPKFSSKSDNELQFSKSAGIEFRSVIDLGKKERKLKDVLRYFWHAILKGMAVACSFFTVWY